MQHAGDRKRSLPISRFRYYLLLAGYIPGCYLLLFWIMLVSVFIPRYRKIIKAYYLYIRTAIKSIRVRERITVE
jgi:hypothetical protein